MKQVKLLNTEIGFVPVVLEEKEENGEKFVNGTVLGENSIFIQAKTEAFCMDQLRKAFECLMHFWVRSEFSDINLTYESKVSKNWYNEW